MTSLDDFHDIKPTMLWRGAAEDQLKRFRALGARFGVEPEVVSAHTSKSIRLPVVKLALDAGDFALRDNFYDTNLMVKLKEPCKLSLTAFFEGISEPKDWAWYLSEVTRAQNYSWREWTDEEINDPRILRVKAPGGYWRTTTGEKKDRWLARMTDPSWYERDWSSGKLAYDGPFGPEAKFFVQSTAFAEGIDTTGAKDYYMPGSKHFILALGTIEAAGDLIERIIRA